MKAVSFAVKDTQVPFISASSILLSLQPGGGEGSETSLEDIVKIRK